VGRSEADGGRAAVMVEAVRGRIGGKRNFKRG